MKLQAFKDYVHKRLDDAGIEKEPNGEHSKAGCRIGDRLDIVFDLASLNPTNADEERNRELEREVARLLVDNSNLRGRVDQLITELGFDRMKAINERDRMREALKGLRDKIESWSDYAHENGSHKLREDLESQIDPIVALLNGDEGRAEGAETKEP